MKKKLFFAKQIKKQPTNILIDDNFTNSNNWNLYYGVTITGGTANLSSSEALATTKQGFTIPNGKKLVIETSMELGLGSKDCLFGFKLNNNQEVNITNGVMIGDTNYDNQGMYLQGTGTFVFSRTYNRTHKTARMSFVVEINGTNVSVVRDGTENMGVVLPTNLDNRTIYFFLKGGGSYNGGNMYNFKAYYI